MTAKFAAAGDIGVAVVTTLSCRYLASIMSLGVMPTTLFIAVAGAMGVAVLPAWCRDTDPPASPSAPDLAAPDRVDNPDSTMDRFDRLQSEVEALRRKTDEQEKKIEELKSENGEVWLTAQRAQQIRGIVTDALSDSANRSSFRKDGAIAGYDNGFYLASADGNYRMNIGGQVQSRFSYAYATRSSLNSEQRQAGAQSESGFELRRVRINFFGHVFDPSWTYRVQFASDRDGGNLNNPFNLEDVFIQKALGDGFFLRAGQWKNFFNYEENTSSRTQQFAERSLVNQYYNTKWIQGILLGWESEKLRTYASYNDGGANRNLAAIQPNGEVIDWAFTGRVEYKLDGDWGQFKDMQGWRGSPFAAMVGAAVNWQHAPGNPPDGRPSIGNGQISPTTNDQLTLLTYTADFNLRGNGWSLWSAFLGNYLYDGGNAAVAQGIEGSLSYGAVVQGGFFVADALELIARYEFLRVNSGQAASDVNSALSRQTLNLATVGFNYYFNKNDVKFTLDAGWAFDSIQFSNGLFGEPIAGTDWRGTGTGTGNGGVVVRAQLQLLF